MQAFDPTKLLHEQPEYVVFNGSVGSFLGDTSLYARVGETVRIFFGVGGPNLDSSFHIVGESFDRVWQEGAQEFVSNVQTTLVPPGGATMVESEARRPGRIHDRRSPHRAAGEGRVGALRRRRARPTGDLRRGSLGMGGQRHLLRAWNSRREQVPCAGGCSTTTALAARHW